MRASASVPPARQAVSARTTVQPPSPVPQRPCRPYNPNSPSMMTSSAGAVAVSARSGKARAWHAGTARRCRIEDQRTVPLGQPRHPRAGRHGHRGRADAHKRCTAEATTYSWPPRENRAGVARSPSGGDGLKEVADFRVGQCAGHVGLGHDAHQSVAVDHRKTANLVLAHGSQDLSSGSSPLLRLATGGSRLAGSARPNTDRRERTWRSPPAIASVPGEGGTERRRVTGEAARPWTTGGFRGARGGRVGLRGRGGWRSGAGARRSGGRRGRRGRRGRGPHGARREGDGPRWAGR